MGLVSIVIGSDSDLDVMKAAAEVLEELEISYRFTIASGHRTPDRAISIASRAEDEGIDVFIAGAGGAAHLPGLMASYTVVPVIGVPIKTEAFGGLDSLCSMVQMPSGVSVATVGVNGSKNAGLMAAAIIATKDENIRKRLKDYRQRLEKSVAEKGMRLEKVGWKDY